MPIDAIPIHFVKYQSLGNDFILIDSRVLHFSYNRISFKSKPWQNQVKTWCNRHFGIGADGVLIFFEGTLNPEVLIFNADGSEGQFSGNGSRCAAHYYVSLYPKIKTFILQMGGKDLICAKSKKKTLL